MKPLKTIFIGTPDFGIPALNNLYNDANFDLLAVITQPDKKTGRKQILTPPPIKKRAEKLGVTVYQPDKIAAFKKDLISLSADIVIVIAYAQIIPEDMLNVPKLGYINIHGSLLPKYRGAACIQASILNGDNKTGVTIMQMDKGLDTGPILAQKSVEIENTDTAESLFKKLSVLGAELLAPTLMKLAQGKLVPLEQNDQAATNVKTLKKSDGHIDWKKSADYNERFIRAMHSWPGAFSFFIKPNQDKQIIKILSSEPCSSENCNYKIGQIFIVGKKLNIKCGANSLIINKIQLAGKKPISGEEFLRGHNNMIGKILT